MSPSRLELREAVLKNPRGPEPLGLVDGAAAATGCSANSGCTAGAATALLDVAAAALTVGGLESASAYDVNSIAPRDAPQMTRGHKRPKAMSENARDRKDMTLLPPEPRRAERSVVGRRWLREVLATSRYEGTRQTMSHPNDKKVTRAASPRWAGERE
jgi:hypothetical protein